MPDSLRDSRVRDIVEDSRLGVSFSVKECEHYGVEWKQALEHTLELGFRRFRLMSYWDLHEPTQGEIDFSLLKEQIEIVKQAGGTVTLAIGMRQPRWPETHIPSWAKTMPKQAAKEAYMLFHEAVIKTFKNEEAVLSWQLENEFWLRSFGESFDFDRARLKQEFGMIRELNPQRPIIISTAKVISIPLFAPSPDIYATSVYRNIYNASKQKYTHTWIRPWVYRIRRWLTLALKRRETVVHELQTEPWGPKANWEMTTEEQFKSMNCEQIAEAVHYAQNTSMQYIDMWGAEWWYWRHKKFHDGEISATIKKLVEGTA